MSFKVKICGLTNLPDARFCAGAGADYLGFIQYPPSPRYIAPENVRQINDWLYGPQTVGVFVNTDAATVNQSCDIAGFDVIQLHGDESPAYCRRIVRPVIKAVSVRPGDTVQKLSRLLSAYKDDVTAFLLDTWHPELSGGTGTCFDWRICKDLAKSYPIILAGGLDPENVKEAIEIVSPWGVDLSSGLEHSPGNKNYDLVTNFFESIAADVPEL